MRDLQELIEEGKEAGKENSHDPVTESHDRKTGIILVGNNSGNFGDRRVLFLIKDDGGTLSIDFFVEVFLSKVFLRVICHCGKRREVEGGRRNGGEDGEEERGSLVGVRMGLVVEDKEKMNVGPTCFFIQKKT